MIPIFVYGTLRTGLYNYNKFLEEKTVNVEKATIEGYDMLDLGSFPGIIEGTNTVIGEVMHIKPKMYMQTLKQLDRLEGYDPSRKGKSLYLRQIQKVKLENGKMIDAYVYIYNEKQGIDYPVVASGDWVNKESVKTNVK